LLATIAIRFPPFAAIPDSVSTGGGGEAVTADSPLAGRAESSFGRALADGDEFE
jgi:hypothetical protein